MCETRHHLGLIRYPDPAMAGYVVQHRRLATMELLRFIEVVEQALGQEAIKNFQPMQPGDVFATAADTKALESWVGSAIHAGRNRCGALCTLVPGFLQRLIEVVLPQRCDRACCPIARRFEWKTGFISMLGLPTDQQ